MQSNFSVHRVLPLSCAYRTAGTAPAKLRQTAILPKSIADFSPRRNHLGHFSLHSPEFRPKQGLQSGAGHTIIEAVVISYYYNV